MQFFEENTDFPKIAIIVPTYNEEKYIKECINSLLNQTYKGKTEIIVVDGMSSDKTFEKVTEMQKRYDNIILLKNPGRFQAAGRNIAINHTDTELIAYLDAHSNASPDWLETLYNSYTKLLQKDNKIVGVGSIYKNAKITSFTNASEVAFGSILSGQTNFSFQKKPELAKVDNCYACLYKKSIIQNAGLYNEQLQTGEDMELNNRLRGKLGYNLYVEPKAITYYYRPETLAGLYRQQFRYGYWRLRVFKTLGKSNLKVFIPSVFWSLLLLSLILSLASYSFFYIFIFLISCYSLVLIANSLFNYLNNKTNPLLLILIFLTIHLGYGLGVVCGLMTLRKFSTDN